MVVDVKFMFYGKKVGFNFYYEVEKFILVVLLLYFYGFRNFMLYWFVYWDFKIILRWLLGLIKVFLEIMKVEFMDVFGFDEF